MKNLLKQKHEKYVTLNNYLRLIDTYSIITKQTLMDSNKEIKTRQNEEWHNDPDNWKFGIIYFNPKDKRLFPPKRAQLAGWTINFANPLSILALILLLIFMYLLYIVLR